MLNIFQSNGILDLILAMVQENPDFAYLNHQTIALSILHTTQVKVIDTKLPGDQSAPVANIFMRPAMLSTPFVPTF